MNLKRRRNLKHRLHFFSFGDFASVQANDLRATLLMMWKPDIVTDVFY
jgi:hypothetical protein